MKTRTLLLLSVATALAILLAGGVFLLQLSNQQDSAQPAELGVPVSVGDVTITVFGSTESADDLLVDVEIGGVDDIDGIDSLRLVTGDRRLTPRFGSAGGRCTSITVAPQRCVVEFDVGAVESSSRVLVMRRGDDQVNWVLTG
jgi:hypothetical protein